MYYNIYMYIICILKCIYGSDMNNSTPNKDLSHRVGLTGSADPCNSGHRQTRQKWRPADGLVIGERDFSSPNPLIGLKTSKPSHIFVHIFPDFRRFWHSFLEGTVGTISKGPPFQARFAEESLQDVHETVEAFIFVPGTGLAVA